MSQNKPAFTPGPWGWFGTASGEDIHLTTTHSGRRYVMSFSRWGLNGAQPVFQPNQGGGMVKAKDLLQFSVGEKTVVGIEAAKKDGSVYRYNIRGIDCADARLIAAAPELYEALEHAQQALAMSIDPEAIQKMPVMHAFAFITAAEHRCRSALAKARGEEQ